MRVPRKSSTSVTGWVAADPHVHTLYSPDSRISLRRLLRCVKTENLGLIAVTDHGTMRGFLELRNAPEHVVVVPGLEVLTSIGDILALFVEEVVGSGEVGEVMDRVHDLDGIAVLPHPYRAHAGNVVALAEEVDAIEVFNARSSVAENAAAMELATSLGKPGLAASDAHVASFLGLARSAFRGETAEEFRKALLAKELRLQWRYPPALARAHDLWSRFRSMAPNRRRDLLRHPERMARAVVGLRNQRVEARYSPDNDRVPRR